jgi:hypothetical protein
MLRIDANIPTPPPLPYEGAAYKENVRPMTLEEFHAMIDRSEEDIRAGRTISQEEVEKRIASWFSL